MTRRIPLSVPLLAGNEQRYLTECVSTNFVSSVGPFVTRFERGFASAIGAADAVACSSGTAAIHLALVTSGAAPGRDVLVSDLTFVAAANPVRYCGADVTLVDSEPRTWNLDPALVVEELRRRDSSGEAQPAAIVAVHLLGHPADLGPILSVATELGVPVVEDAAEALGASWSTGDLAGKAVGTAGSVGCFSFNGNKVLTTGGGGMLVARVGAVATRARHLSTQARIPGPEYFHDDIGYNYRLTNVAAAIGLAQLEQLEGFLDRKRKIADTYDRAFEAIDAIERPPDLSWGRRSSWLYTVLLPDRSARERLRTGLAEDGIETRPIWQPLHRQAAYASCRRIGGGVAEQIADRALSLPSSPSLAGHEQEAVVSAVLTRLRSGDLG